MKQKIRNKLIFKKLKVRLFEIKLKQKVMWDPQIIDNLSKKKKKKKKMGDPKKKKNLKKKKKKKKKTCF